MVTLNDVRISKFEGNAWVNVEHAGIDAQYNLFNPEDNSDDKVKDIIVMAYSICSTIDAIEAHCKLNGILIKLDDIN